MTLYTGDLVTHGPEDELSHAFVEATEDAVWQMFKAYIGGPIYAALGVSIVVLLSKILYLSKRWSIT